jgi:hypothetical protein
VAENLIPSWLPSALSGGLAGSLFTLLVGWLKAKAEAKKIKSQQIRALKEELRHAKWLVEYNHGRIRSLELPNKGLTDLGASNVEQILFSSATTVSLPSNIVEYLHDYLGQVVYHNTLVEEYKVLLLEPLQTSKSVWIDRKDKCLGELEAICTPEATYRGKDEPSLRVRIDRLLNELEKVKI